MLPELESTTMRYIKVPMSAYLLPQQTRRYVGKNGDSLQAGFNARAKTSVLCPCGKNLGTLH